MGPMATWPIRPMPTPHPHRSRHSVAFAPQSLPLPPQILPRKRGSRTSRKPHLLSHRTKKGPMPFSTSLHQLNGGTICTPVNFYINYRFRYPLLTMIAHPLPEANNPLLWREKSPSVQAVTPISDERLWQHYRLSSQPSHSD